MTIDTQNNQAIRGNLENALRQVESTQTQLTAIEGQLQEIKSQINKAVDTVLKQAEVNERNTEKVRNDVAATLGEMFDQMTSIVNGARHQMLQPQNEEPTAQTVVETPPDIETPTVDEIPTEIVSETEILPTEETLTESLTGSQVGQRASASLSEMIATIDEEENAPQEPEHHEETVATIQTPPDTEENAEADEVPTCPGSTNSLSELLVKAKAAAGETDYDDSELMSFDDNLNDEEEDPQAVSELLKNTSGSVIVKN